MSPWRIVYVYQGRKTTYNVADEASARAQVAALKKRGIKNIYTHKL